MNNLLIYRNPGIFDTLCELNLPYEEALAAYQMAFLINTGMGIDRTRPSIFNLTPHAIPDYSTEKTFEEIVYERALQLKQTTDEMTVVLTNKYSFVALKSLNDIGANVKALTTKQFVNANKTIFDDMKYESIKIVDRYEMIQPKQYFGKTITDTHGPLLFTFEQTPWLGKGPPKTREKQKIILHDIIEHIYLLGNSYKNNFQTKTLKEYHLNAYELTEKYLNDMINRAMVSIENTFDLYWWLNFNLQWYAARYKFIGLTGSYIDVESFFDTDDFQSWAITNHTTKTYRMINDFIKYDVNVKYLSNDLMGLNSTGTWKIEFADSDGNISFGRCTTPIEMICGVISNPQ
jgi:hypothetical protein